MTPTDKALARRPFIRGACYGLAAAHLLVGPMLTTGVFGKYIFGLPGWLVGFSVMAVGISWAVAGESVGEWPRG